MTNVCLANLTIFKQGSVSNENKLNMKNTIKIKVSQICDIQKTILNGHYEM
uniref:Uncharacterized protein n=1 Tax=Arundo donax TaxID=35708 RepID=A0A0A8ZEQ9_ARUDO